MMNRTLNIKKNTEALTKDIQEEKITGKMLPANVTWGKKKTNFNEISAHIFK